jgi:hypothetical protein
MTSFHALCFRDCPITAPSVIPTSGLSMQNRANCGLLPNTRQINVIDGAGTRRLFLMTQLADADRLSRQQAMSELWTPNA